MTLQSKPFSETYIRHILLICALTLPSCQTGTKAVTQEDQSGDRKEQRIAPVTPDPFTSLPFEIGQQDCLMVEGYKYSPGAGRHDTWLQVTCRNGRAWTIDSSRSIRHDITREYAEYQLSTDDASPLIAKLFENEHLKQAPWTMLTLPTGYSRLAIRVDGSIRVAYATLGTPMPASLRHQLMEMTKLFRSTTPSKTWREKTSVQELLKRAIERR